MNNKLGIFIMKTNKSIVLFFAMGIVFSACAMENSPQKRVGGRKKRLSRAWTQVTMHTVRRKSEEPSPTRSTFRKSSSDSAAPNSSATLSPAKLDEQSRMEARSKIGVPRPPAPSMLQKDMQSLTGAPPQNDLNLYVPIKPSSKGELVTHEQSPYIHPDEVNRPDEHGRTPLCTAIMRGDAQMVTCLLYSGADVFGKREGGYSMIHEAASSRNPSSEIVYLLVNEGLDPNQLTETGLAPLHLAARSGTPDMFRTLVNLPSTLLDIRSQEKERGSRNTTWRTPLHMLAAGKRKQAPEMAQILLNPGNKKSPADLYAMDAYGKTALKIATENANKKMIAELLKHANFEGRSDVPNSSPHFHLVSIPNGNNARDTSSSSSDNETNDIQYVNTGDFSFK
jgi:ankyrin repeat protein